MLAHRLRRLFNIEPTLGDRLVFGGMYMWHVITQNSVTEDPDVIKSRGYLESVQRLPGGFLSDMRTDQRVTCAMTGDACVMDQVTTRAPLTGDNGGCL